MSNQMNIVLKLKKNKIVINLKKKKHIKLVFSLKVKKSNKEKLNNNSCGIDYDYAYEMDKYDNYDRYDDYYRHYKYRDYHYCVYDEDYETYENEKLYGFTDDYGTYWDSIYN